MTPADPQATAIDLAAGVPMQVARGSVQTDGDGSRQATLLFPQGTAATMKLPDGSIQSLAKLTVRATEYTVGANGPASMPAVMPPNIGYTYCVELTADEAVAANAIEVLFSRPLPFYVENFLRFPVGTTMPVCFYDRNAGIWVASDNGKAIKILSIMGGKADLEADGDGMADSSATLAALGVTDAERGQLAALYGAGKTQWRFPVAHFSAWDANWGTRCKDNICDPPNQPMPEVEDGEDEPRCEEG